MRKDIYTTKKYHPVCINLEPRHFLFLRELAKTRFDGNYSDAIQFLLSKYLNYLYEVRITPTKRTETANYQPRTKHYKKWVISINPVIWSKLFESRHFLGYSMSALLRIVLDWEMYSMGYDIIPLIPMPNINLDDISFLPISTPEKQINNYFYVKQGIYEPREIFCSFSDKFR